LLVRLLSGYNAARAVLLLRPSIKIHQWKLGLVENGIGHSFGIVHVLDLDHRSLSTLAPMRQ
jgi:hypothetical protein